MKQFAFSISISESLDILRYWLRIAANANQGEKQSHLSLVLASISRKFIIITHANFWQEFTQSTELDLSTSFNFLEFNKTSLIAFNFYKIRNFLNRVFWKWEQISKVSPKFQ